MDINNVIINVGYDDIGKPNQNHLDIEPNWNIHAKTNIQKLLGEGFGHFVISTTDHFIHNNKNFIYPIVLFDNKIFENHVSIDFDDKLIGYIKFKKCRIVFVYILEAYFNNECVQWINNLCDRYKFDKDDVLVLTSNLIRFTNNNFIIYNYNYFGNHFQFLHLFKVNEKGLKIYENNYLKFIGGHNKLHFLCFNGHPRQNRVMMYNELTTNEQLIGKSIVTLRSKDKNYYYDIPNWENQTLSSGAHLNIQAHMDCFLNIVTETLFDDTTIFITEKTYKPIYLCQPFIVFGNPYVLRTLKGYGFKTFDKWWSEDYDNELDLNNRFNKIVSVLEEISTWDMDKCYEIKNEMKDILIHNYKTMFQTNEIKSLFLTLQCETKTKINFI